MSRANYPPFYICQIFNRNIPLLQLSYAFSIDNDDVYFANIALLKKRAQSALSTRIPHIAEYSTYYEAIKLSVPTLNARTQKRALLARDF